MIKNSSESSLVDRLNALTGKNPKIQKIENGIEEKIDHRHFNKRTPGSGRKPSEEKLIQRGIKALIDEHVNGEVDIQVADPKTGRVRMMKKPRVIVVLEKLFQIGMREGDVDALNKWLDRALGKPKQAPLENEEERPLLIFDMNTRLQFNRMLDKVYGTMDDTEKQDNAV